MIRPERLSMDSATFAAERKKHIVEAEEMIADASRYAMTRIGLPGWQDILVEAALDLFDLAVKAETDAASQVTDDLRAEFAREITEALEKTKRQPDPERQRQQLARWVATASMNAATEAATAADPDGAVGLEWVSMSDADVRSTHRDVHGTSIPSGGTWEIGGEEFSYPGQPKGDPALWINCRCVARPTMLNTASGQSATFSLGNASDPGLEPGEEPKAAVVVLLPRDGDPITEIASGAKPHCTLLYLGDKDTDLGPLLDHVLLMSEQTGTLMTDKINGRAVLGDDKADVVLLEATASGLIRAMLMENEGILELLAMQEQFPSWIPHLTLGYPEAPALEGDMPEDVTYDRLAVWRGDEQWEFPLEPPHNKEKTPMTQSITAAAESAVAAPLPIDTTDWDEEMASVEGLSDEFQNSHVPWHGVLAPEGVPSSDGRQFAKGSLTTRALPIPLKWMPADAERHGGSVIVGRIDRVWRNEAGLVCGEGVFDTSPAAYEAIRQIANQMLRGVSVDVGDIIAGVVDEEQGDIEFAAAKLAAATLCAIPAFKEAFVALGPWTEKVTASFTMQTENFDLPPAKTKDGPGWVTDPKPTKQITGYWVDGRGAAKIGWGAPGDFERCRTNLGKYVQNPEWLAGLCANLHYRALGVWPGQQHAGEVVSMGKESLVASVSIVADERKTLPADWFRNPELTEPTPLTVTEDGRVFGHLATWGTCHIGYADECSTAPNSYTNYSYFLTGEVDTDAGPVSVGQITMDGPHANERASLRATLAHYDQTTTAVADITAGEDGVGIWVAGALRDDLTSAQIRKLRGAALSGDWRRVVVNGQGNLEMVAALAVNVPGFPIPRTSLAASAGHQTSLVAAGMVRRGENGADHDDKVARMNKARLNMRAHRASSLRSKLTMLEGR